MTMALIFLEQYESFQLLRMKREEESQPANKSEESASKGTVAEGTQMPRLVPSSEEQQS